MPMIEIFVAITCLLIVPNTFSRSNNTAVVVFGFFKAIGNDGG